MCGVFFATDTNQSLQAQCEELEGSMGASSVSKHLEELKQERSVHLSKLGTLEKEVFQNRGLLEEEEQVMYCDAINELDALYEEMKQVRASQGYQLTPWVCTSALSRWV